MTVDRAAIQRLVPHAGAMCLLDHVTDWSEAHIECHACAPSLAHPLARDGALPAAAACEYAAQAAAVHGALLDGAQTPRVGMLAKLTDVELHISEFPAGEGLVAVRAEVVSRLESGCLYAFAVASGRAPVASGRLIVSFSAAGSS